MSTGGRAYNLLRAYILREWDRIQGVERDVAEEELNTAMRTPSPAPTREQFEEPLYAFVSDPPSVARRLLGVSEKASFEEIRKAFERLDRRCDPGRFPEGSDARMQAEEIRKRLNWAYQALAEAFDTTEKRFKSLELE